ncbi:MAG: undecaprenyl-diphosphate phosphatase [Flavobacteriales bacterium]|nr:undecaprenyl-diphosphate phosphatase [Flavobacteriales bacterium]
MSEFEALILGIIQGLTEFLPVSSSGHLELAKALFGSETLPEDSLLITVVLHAATALSTLVIFRKDIGKIIKGLVQFKSNDEFHYSLKIVVSMIPAAIIGLMFNDLIETFYEGKVQLVGGMLLLTAVLLYFADKVKRTTSDITYFHSIAIGVAQAIAILPGISRSGATICTSVLLKVDRETAARFSFLMVVPLIVGKMAKDIMDGALTSSNIEAIPLGLGFIAAFGTGLVACTWMISIVKRSKLIYFALYCLVVGIIALILG